MFEKSLSTKLLQLLDDKNITQDKLAETCDLSPRFIGNIIRGHQVPRLDSFEKICAALEVTPDDLLISPKSKETDKAIHKQVTQIIRKNEQYLPLCPACGSILSRTHQAYCDNCGQALGWSMYFNADILD